MKLHVYVSNVKYQNTKTTKNTLRFVKIICVPEIDIQQNKNKAMKVKRETIGINRE